MPDSASLEQLKAQYFLLDRNFDDLLGAAGTDAEKQQLRDSYEAARSNFQAARVMLFDQESADVRSLTSQLEAAHDELETMVSDLGKVSDFISKLATAVSIGTKLVALGTA